MADNTTISFIGPVEVKQYLDSKAKELDRSLSSLMRIIINDWREQNGEAPLVEVDERQLRLPVAEVAG